MLLTFENLSRILRLEPASQPQNLRAEPQKFERVTPRSSYKAHNEALIHHCNKINKSVKIIMNCRIVDMKSCGILLLF